MNCQGAARRREAPNSKHQAPEKHQASNSKSAGERQALGLGTWSFSGAWSLELGASLRSSKNGSPSRYFFNIPKSSSAPMHPSRAPASARISPLGSMMSERPGYV